MSFADILGFLRAAGPLGLERGQWLAILPAVALCALLGRLLGRATAALLRRASSRTQARWDDELAARLDGPLAVGWGFALGFGALAALSVPESVAAAVTRLLRTGLLVAVFWAALRAVAVGAQVASHASADASIRSLIALGSRVVKVLVVAVAAVAVLSELGYPAASLIAGLGIGGLALALAAQKTVENVFGAFSIGFDQPFREGDTVKVEDFTGTVESIGLRSTRIRTPDRSIITIPNGRLADMRIESLTARDRLRLSCTLGLVYSTTADQMQRVLAGVERALLDHPRIWPEGVTVRFKELAASSLDIEVTAWFGTTDWTEFQLIRQELLLQFMRVVESCGTGFAFPTRTVHLVGPEAPRP